MFHYKAISVFHSVMITAALNKLLNSKCSKVTWPATHVADISQPSYKIHIKMQALHISEYYSSYVNCSITAVHMACIFHASKEH